jgi:hypothetical protein
MKRPPIGGRGAVKKAAATAIWLAFVASVWAAAPVVAVGFNLMFRADYVVRDFASEYEARLTPNRVHWFDFKDYRMNCGTGERRAVVLHTNEFEESPAEFLARKFPECSNFSAVKDTGLPGVHGVLVGRW